MIGVYSAALLELILLLTGYLTDGVRWDPAVGFYEIPTKLYLLHFLVFASVPAYGLFRLIETYRKSDLPIRKNQIKYVIYANLIAFLGGGTSFLPIIQASIPPYGNPLAYFYIFPITYAIAKYRLLDIDVVIKKSVIYVVLLLGLLLPCYLIVIWGQTLAFGTVNFKFSLATLLLFITVGFFFQR